MAGPEVAIRITGDADLDDARRDAERTFDRIADAADEAAEGLERPFARAADRIPDEFDRVDDGVRSALAGVADEAERAAAGVEDPFADAARRIPDEFDQVEAGVRGSLSGVADEAERAADGIERPFADAARGIPDEFDGVRSELRGTWSGVESDAESAADGVEGSFDRAGRAIPDGFAGVRARLASEWDGVEADARDAAEGIGEQLSTAGDYLDPTQLGQAVAGQLQGLAGAGGPVLGVAAGLGALFGAELAEGFSAGFNANRNTVSLGIRTGLDEIDLQQAGVGAGAAYAAGFGESLGQTKFALAAFKQELDGLSLGDGDDQITKELVLLEEQFGIDLPRATDITKRAIAQGLVPDATSGLELIFAIAQKLPVSFDESLDVLSEYAPTFGEINGEAGNFANFLVSVEKSGAFENVSQGAEALREFNTRLTETDTLSDVLGEIGLDAQELQAALLRGDMAGAISAIAAALADMEDKQRANEIAGQIFGSAVEDVGDRIGAVQVLADGLSGSLDDMAGSLDNATESTEAAVSQWELAQRSATDFGVAVGERAAAHFNRYADAVNQVRDAAGRLEIGLDGVRFRSDEVTESVIDTSAAAREAAGQHLLALNDGLGEVEDGATGAADGLRDVRAELDSLFNFGADQLMRGIADATDRLADSFDELDDGVIRSNGSINTATKEGRALQEAFERVSAQQERNIALFNEGEITAGEFARANQQIEANLRNVLGAAGLTERQIDALIDKYYATPDEVKTRVTVEGDAEDTIDAIRAALLNLPTSRTITVTTLQRASAGPNSPYYPPSSTSTRSNVVRQRARGGWTEGLTLVGEEGAELGEYRGRRELFGLAGPELVHFTTPAKIYSHEETIRRVEVPRMASGGVATSETMAIVGDNFNVAVNPEIIAPQDLMADTFRSVLAEQGRGGPAIVIQHLEVRDGRDFEATVERMQMRSMAAAS